MDWMAILLIMANGLTLVWALKLLGRQPNRRLRYLVLTVSIVSISQTVAFLCHLQGQSLIQAASVLQQCVTSMGTMAAVYLLWVFVLRFLSHEILLKDHRLFARNWQRTQIISCAFTSKCKHNAPDGSRTPCVKQHS